MNDKKIVPTSMTIPLCKACNSALGAELEGPVGRAFEDIEAGRGLTDSEAELLVRWLWKFEGFVWMLTNADDPNRRYSELYTLKDRVLGHAIGGLRNSLILAVSVIEKNDDGLADWPIGINSQISDRNAVFVSGVFSRVALMVSMVHLAGGIPASYSFYSFAGVPEVPAKKVFFPKVGFANPTQAILTSMAVSRALLAAHEHEFANDVDGGLIVPRRRVELPD